MFKTKCGCPDCKNQRVGFSRDFWKSRKNKHNRSFGTRVKGKKHQRRHSII